MKDLDNWVSFYFKHGRFPGNNDLTILPQTNLPSTVDQLSVEVSPVQLYEKFGKSDSKKLVSFQAIVALFLYYGGERMIAKKAMEEWKENLTFQALSKEDNNITMKFDYLTEIVLHFLKAFLTLETEFKEFENSKMELFEKTLEKYSREPITSTPDSKAIRKVFPPTIFDTPDSLSKIDSDFLKTSLTLSKTNLDASIDAAEEENRIIIQDIVDPTPGLFVNETFTNDDLNTMKIDDESKFKLNNQSMKKVNEISENISKNISYFQEMLHKYEVTFKPTENENKEFSVELPKKQIEILKSDLNTKIKSTKKNQIKNAPYNLRSTKRKFNMIESTDLLEKPFVHLTSNENEKNKIKAAEKVFNSVLKNLPEHSKNQIYFGFIK